MMAFVCARPDLATRALGGGKPIPGEAGFMGLLTLEDVLENILQSTIIDEEDQTDRNLASATLTHWAAQKIQESYRQRKKAREQKRKSVSPNKGGSIAARDDERKDTEVTSLLENGHMPKGTPPCRSGPCRHPGCSHATSRAYRSKARPCWCPRRRRRRRSR